MTHQDSGIYIHVPFCRSRCIYCDFFSTTLGEEVRRAYTPSVCDELRARADEGEKRQIATIYFGGGTPSLLGPDEVETIMRTIRTRYEIRPDAEITMEANPDDISTAWVKGRKALGINRVSMGVQTFSDKALRFLRRRHSAAQAYDAVGILTGEGIDNVTIDLIYGLPEQTLADWEKDVAKALSLPIKHLSAYALSYETGTPIYRLREAGAVRETDEELSLAMYEHLMEATSEKGMEHYEISNFALPAFRSRHNSSYWKGTPYIGIGPGAHSFDGERTRRQNLPELQNYIAHAGNAPHVLETLSEEERCDERVFTSLRTCEGLDLAALEGDFGTRLFREVCRSAQPHLHAGLLEEKDGHYILTRKGLFVSDRVMSDMMTGD